MKNSTVGRVTLTAVYGLLKKDLFERPSVMLAFRVSPKLGKVLRVQYKCFPLTNPEIVEFAERGKGETTLEKLHSLVGGNFEVEMWEEWEMVDTERSLVPHWHFRIQDLN